MSLFEWLSLRCAVRTIFGSIFSHKNRTKTAQLPAQCSEKITIINGLSNCAGSAHFRTRAAIVRAQTPVGVVHSRHTHTCNAQAGDIGKVERRTASCNYCQAYDFLFCAPPARLYVIILHPGAAPCAHTDITRLYNALEISTTYGASSPSIICSYR